MTLVLADLAWFGPVVLAQTDSHNGQAPTVPAVVLNQQYRVAADSLMVDDGTLSARKFSFNSINVALPVTQVTPTSGLIMSAPFALHATLLFANRASLGRAADELVLSAHAQPPRKLETIGKGQQATHYWTLRRKIETIAVTLLHTSDAAQSCWHEANTPRWHEQNSMTPDSCLGASVVLVGSGPLLQWASYRLTRRYPDSRFWARIERGLPQIEIAVSVMSIRCSNSKRGCNQYGF